MNKFFRDQSFKLIDINEYNTLINNDFDNTRKKLLSIVIETNYIKEDFIYFEINEMDFDELKNEAINELNQNECYLENYILNYSTIFKMKKYFFLDLDYMLFKSTYDSIHNNDLFKRLYLDYYNNSNYLDKISDDEDYLYSIFNEDGKVLLLNELKKYQSCEVQYFLNQIETIENQNIKICLKKVL